MSDLKDKVLQYDQLTAEEPEKMTPEEIRAELQGCLDSALDDYIAESCRGRRLAETTSAPGMSDEQFTCDCRNGETRIISERRVEHKCGFRPSASYGTLGVWQVYRRVRNITGRYNWFVDWQSQPATK